MTAPARPLPALRLALPLLVACAGAARVRGPAPDGPHLSVLTYNVNFGLSGDPDGIRAIAAADADLVLLQETTPAWQHALEGAFAERYPFRAFQNEPGAGGLAVLSRRRFDLQGLTRAPAPWSFPAWRLVVHSDFGPVQVLGVHLRPPVSDSGSWVSGACRTPAIRERELLVHAAPLDPLLPTIIAGDFNEEDGRASRLLRDRGLRDALAELQPDATTWRWPVLAFELRRRLDHVWYTPSLEALDARVLPLGRSDHRPVFAVFRAAARPPAP